MTLSLKRLFGRSMTGALDLAETPTPTSPRSAARKTMLVSIALLLAVIGTLVGGYYFAMRPVTLRIAVGPPNSDDIKVVQALTQAFAQSHGYVAAGYGGLDLDEAVADAPAIVPIQAKGYDHFVVLRGRLDNRIVLADPAYGNRTLTIDQFLAIWPNRIAFVLHRPDGSAGGPGLAARADLLLVPTDSAVRAAELGARREIHP